MIGIDFPCANSVIFDSDNVKPIVYFEQARRQATSVLLGPEADLQNLVHGATRYVTSLAVLPSDPKADALADEFFASGPNRGSRKLLKGK
jgi:hypothetical protein